ncbi:MAG: C4-type zinc ribbon domain-containing protein [Bacteroidales bacterium]
MKETKSKLNQASLEEGDYGIEQKMIALYALQQLDSKIDSIRIIRGELPLEVQDLEDDIAGYDARIEKYTEEAKVIEKNISDRKAAIIEFKAQIKKYEKQQKDVRNNREFDSLSKEIEFQGLEIQLNEKRIKEAIHAYDQKSAELDRVVNLRDERQKDLDMKQSELNEIICETEKDEKDLMEKSAAYSAHIEKRWVENYQRIRNNAKNGLAVVCIDRDACGGCFSKIPPQRQLEIQMHKKIYACEYCGRFLVDEDIKEKANKSL